MQGESSALAFPRSRRRPKCCRWWSISTHSKPWKTCRARSLERLFTETLDCCAHRLDAWITSLVTRRLEEMREAQPDGVHVGAFGWVEDVQPDFEKRHHTREGANERRLMQNASGGYIHAPSMDHAAAAAVLRSAFLTRTGTSQEQFGLDLVVESRAHGALADFECSRRSTPSGTARLWFRALAARGAARQVHRASATAVSTRLRERGRFDHCIRVDLCT